MLLLSWSGSVDDSAPVMGHLLQIGPEAGLMIRGADEELITLGASPDLPGLEEAPAWLLGCGHIAHRRGLSNP